MDRVVAALQGDIEHDRPFLRGLVPHHLGNAIPARDLPQHRISVIFRKRPAVRAVGDALHGGISRSSWPATRDPGTHARRYSTSRTEGRDQWEFASVL